MRPARTGAKLLEYDWQSTSNWAVAPWQTGLLPQPTDHIFRGRQGATEEQRARALSLTVRSTNVSLLDGIAMNLPMTQCFVIANGPSKACYSVIPTAPNLVTCSKWQPALVAERLDHPATLQ